MSTTKSNLNINRAQANALAEGFLDDLGFRGDEFVPANSVLQLLLLAAELVEDAQKNLEATHSNASGKLSDSIQATQPVAAHGIIQIDIEMNFYGQFLNKGVKGTKSGNGPYSFKNEIVSRKFADAIQKYIKSAKNKIGSIKKVYYKNENKFRKISEASSAYGMARSIKRKGIKAVYFMDRAIESTDKKVSERFGDALGIDLLNSLPDKLN